jgi:hypothetical protein
MDNFINLIFNLEQNKENIFDNLNIDILDSKNNYDNIQISKQIKYIIKNKLYNTNKYLKLFDFVFLNNFTIITNKNQNYNIYHNNFYNHVKNELNIIIFDNTTYLPILYHSNSLSLLNNNHKNYIHKNYSDILNSDIIDSNIQDKKISIYRNYNGKYILLFNNNDEWYFVIDKTVYEYNIINNPILYSYIEDQIDDFNKNEIYEFILVDSKIKKIIKPITSYNYLVHISDNTNITYINNIIKQEEIFVSCYDELELYLYELESENIASKKLINCGIIMYHKEYNCKYTIYTETYTKLYNMIKDYPDLTPDQIHFKLYQNDKLNLFLPYINNTYTDIVKRINISISTISHEILDIYHNTRNKKNSNLYNNLSPLYKKILFELHNLFIKFKSNSDNVLNNKISITVDDVYTKIKNMDIITIKQLYIDRNVLLSHRNKYNIDLIRNCSETQLQSILIK